MTRSYTRAGRQVNDTIRTVDDDPIRQDNQSGTGVYTGGAITINGSDNTKIDITAGTGIVVDHRPDPVVPKIIPVAWEAYSSITVDSLSTALTSYIGIDRSGNISQFAGTLTAQQRRDNIILGLVVHTTNTVVESVSNFVVTGYGYAQSLIDLAAAIGLINGSGNVFSANTTNLTLAKTVGTSFRLGGNYTTDAAIPNSISSGSLVAPSLFKPYRDGSGGFQVDSPLTTSVDPTKWDNDSGTLQTVTADSPWTVQRIYYDPVNDDTIVHYGQTQYKQLDIAEDAIQGEDFEKNPILQDAILRSFMIIHKDCTDLTDTSKVKFIQADKFGQVPAGGSSPATNTGALLAVATAKTSDFTTNFGKAYIIDNTSGPIVGTLAAATLVNIGQACECWILGNTATHNVTFKAPDIDHTINGQASADPAVAAAVFSGTSNPYKKVVIRVIAEDTYLVEEPDSLTTV